LTGRALLDAAIRTFRLHQPPATAASPERIPHSSLERFAAARRAARPVLLDGLVEALVDEKNWSLADLRSRFADRQIAVIPAREGRLRCDPNTGTPFATVRLGDYIDDLENGGGLDSYVSAPAKNWLPELYDAVRTPAHCRDAAWRNARFWLGPAGTLTPLHRDVAENIFLQIAGRKRFRLYPPAASPWLYSNGFRSALPNFSRFDPELPDYERLPLSREVAPLELILEPGDALYLPSRWWHHVRSLDVAMSFNFWFADGVLAYAVRAAELVKRTRRLEIYGLEARLGGSDDAAAG
jgi:hypothetical protein